jgi:hypothetical protein
MTLKFLHIIVLASWYLEAQYRFITSSERNAIAMLHCRFYDQKTKYLTQAGKENWDVLYRDLNLPEELVRPSFHTFGEDKLAKTCR